MATIINNENPNALENPNKTLDPIVPPAAKPDPDPSQHATHDSPSHPPSDAAPITDKESEESKETAATAEAGHDAPLSDIQKKIRRAERFGISVQLSEKEKRNSRAERFGTGSTLQASEPSKSEELKRKARAERFGIPSPSTAAEEEAKKKARLARFAPVYKTDPLEEDKRKARAVRFSNPSSNSLPKVNGEGNIEPKAAIAGKAGGGT